MGRLGIARGVQKKGDGSEGVSFYGYATAVISPSVGASGKLTAFGGGVRDNVTVLKDFRDLKLVTMVLPVGQTCLLPAAQNFDRM